MLWSMNPFLFSYEYKFLYLLNLMYSKKEFHFISFMFLVFFKKNEKKLTVMNRNQQTEERKG